MAETFCNTIEDVGYFVGVYANTYWFNNKLTDNRFNNWVKWVAQYAANCSYQGEYDMWQYTSSGSINGVNGSVDVNECYKDYPALIKSLGLNNHYISVSTPSEAIPTPEPIETTYKVQSGDTLGAIASKFNTSVNTLASVNNIANPNVIYPGQQLIIK